MKKSILLLFALSLSLLVSCRDEKAPEKTEEQEKNVKVTVSALVKVDDDFQLFFREEDNISTPFEENNSVWVSVKASDKPQNIEFVLPENTLPNYLRLDIGKNEKQQPITISGLKIDFLDKKIEMNPTNLFETYFVHNNCVEIKDKSKGEVVTKKDENGIYDPVINSGENLKFELQKMYK
ncbi:MAG: hypothetical protein ACOVMH_07895 [Flavobacterium sp.]